MDKRLPLPPFDLAERVGGLDPTDPFADYLQIGSHGAALVRSLLPPDWGFEGRSILDFGCGSGRTIRHLAGEAESAQILGCDIHVPSIAWAQRHLSPPFRFFVNDEAPPLDLPGASVDLVYAISVFTHIDRLWAEWLLELRRVLRPGGLAVLSFLGPAMGPIVLGEPWHDERMGMTVVEIGKSWDHGGPNVLHAEWWLREHWGRAFEIVELVPCSDPATQSGQGLIVLRRPESQPPSADELRRPAPEQPAELEAVTHNLDLLRREVTVLRAQLDHERAAAAPALAAAQAEAEAVRGHLNAVLATRAWRLTKPLRALRGLRERT